MFRLDCIHNTFLSSTFGINCYSQPTLKPAGLVTTFPLESSKFCYILELMNSGSGLNISIDQMFIFGIELHMMKRSCCSDLWFGHFLFLLNKTHSLLSLNRSRGGLCWLSCWMLIIFYMEFLLHGGSKNHWGFAWKLRFGSMKICSFLLLYVISYHVSTAEILFLHCFSWALQT